MKRKERERCVRYAALLYTRGEQNAEELGDIVGMSGRTLYRIANNESHACHQLWHAELDALGFEGIRNFRVTPRGRKPDITLKEKVKPAWQKLTENSPNLSRREIARQLQTTYPELGFWRAMGWLREFEKEST